MRAGHSDHEPAGTADRGAVGAEPQQRADRATRSPRTTTSYWDRPKPPRDWHWFLGRLGSSLIVAGLLVFLFVGYQLWGTGIEAAQSQQRLEDAFADAAMITGEVENAPSQLPEPIQIVDGDPMALIEIPAIGISKYVVAGVQTSDLKKGPGHYPNTPFPGELGNAAIAGHRTTYGEPFRQLDELEVGDPIIVTDLVGRRFTYLVTDQRIVSPKDSWVVDTADPTIATLTLTTCHPEFSAKQRLIVFAELDPTRSDTVSFRAATYGMTNGTSTTSGQSIDTANTIVDDGTANGAVTGDDGSDSPEPATNEVIDDVFDKGWFSDPSAIPHVVAWILLEILIVLVSWLIAKRLRNRAIGTAIGLVPFFVTLYFVFQNVNRLLPPNL